MTKKFVATEEAAITERVQFVLDAFNATAKIEARVGKSNKSVSAYATLVNGSGPFAVDAILTALKTDGIWTTPVRDVKEDGMKIRRFTVFKPSDSWDIIPTKTKEISMPKNSQEIANV